MRILGTLALLCAAALAATALAGDPPASKDWKNQMGKLPFVVGIDKGREQVKSSGKPAMLFFTQANDSCVQFAKVWDDDEVVASVACWTPVLLDADATPQDLKDKWMGQAQPPVVAWIDFDEKRVFVSRDDTDVEKFRMAAAKAAARCPKARAGGAADAAAPEATPASEAKKKFDAAVAAKDVKAQFASIAEIRKLGAAAGADLAKAADAAFVRLTKDGDAELERIRGLLAAKKKADAVTALQKLVDSYPADHDVGRKAQAMLDAAKKPPPAPPKK